MKPSTNPIHVDGRVVRAGDLLELRWGPSRWARVQVRADEQLVELQTGAALGAARIVAASGDLRWPKGAS